MAWLWIVAVGGLIGLALGALGGGGSILTVPALVYLADQSPAEATTGSLVIVGVSAAIGMTAHARSGNVRVRQGLVFGLLGTVGAVVGSRLSVLVPAPVLLTTFAGLLFVVAGIMTRRLRRADDAQASTSTSTVVGWSWSPGALTRLVLAATAVGLLTGLFGVGGGFAVVPALVLALGFELPVAVGTSLLVIAMNAATAFAVRLQVGVDLDWALIAGFTAVAVTGAVVGARLASRMNPRPLSWAFILLVILIGLYVAARNVPLLV